MTTPFSSMMQKTRPSGRGILPVPHDISPEYLAAIVESLDEAIIGQTLDGIITSWNYGAERLYGHTEGEAVGQHISLIIPPERIDDIMAIYQRIMNGERIRGFETLRVARDGRELDIILSIVPLRDQEGSITGAVAIARDITERKEMERRLTFQANLLQNISDAVIATDLDYRIRSWNYGAEVTFGWPEEETLGQTVGDLLQTDFLHVTREQVRAEFNAHGSWRGEVIQRHRDGHLVDISTLVSLVRSQTGTPIGIVAVHRDITAHKRLEQEILRISQREQRRIGQDLHDGLGSHLSGLTMLSRGLTDDLRRGGSIRVEEMEELTDLLRQGVEQARELARGLNPLWNKSHGLVHALHDIAGRAERLYHIPCLLQLHATIPDLHEEIATRLYWIVQEGVNNAVKHARAGSIRIDANYDRGVLVLSVEDNGIGIPLEQIPGNGMGMHIMRNRAETIGAALTIAPRKGGGTIVSCSVRIGTTLMHPIEQSGEGE